MGVKYKKVITGFACVGVIVVSVFFWLNEPRYTAHREKPKSEPLVYQSKILPVEKTEKARSAIAAESQEVKVISANNSVQAIQNILNIKLRKEMALTSVITSEKAKSERSSLKITALRLKKTTVIHLTQAL